MTEFTLSWTSTSICTSLPSKTCQLTISKASSNNWKIVNSWWVKTEFSESPSALTNKTVLSLIPTDFRNFWKAMSPYFSLTSPNKTANSFSVHSKNLNSQQEEQSPHKQSYFTKDLKLSPNSATQSNLTCDNWACQQDWSIQKFSLLPIMFWPKKARLLQYNNARSWNWCTPKWQDSNFRSRLCTMEKQSRPYFE